MVKLRAIEGIGARILEFLIWTAARSGDALGAQWNEIDLDQKLWTIPGERMEIWGRSYRAVMRSCDRNIEGAIRYTLLVVRISWFQG